MAKDPIPGLDLPHWVENLILVVFGILIRRYLPSLLNEEESNGAGDL